MTISTNHRAFRKLLECTLGKLSLHSDSTLIFGLATLGDYDPNNEDLFEVRFIGHHHWELTHANHVMMSVKSGFPSLPYPPFDAEQLRLDLKSIFKGISLTDIDTLISLVAVAEQEKHGTMLIITGEAENEANRLRIEGTPITPLMLTPELLRHFTAIDGAVILSPQGICYGIGTILDGVAAGKGDSGRGARYNSAVRYVTNRAAPCLAVVVSVDGGINFIPNSQLAIN